MADPERFDVPVNGGELAVYRWPGEGPIVLAAHGLTSNAISWGVVADALDGDVTLIAPDLRGRGRSNGLPGPFGIAQHADDLAMVLDAIGAEQVVIAGHSMGGFIAALFAVRHAARASSLVLVDGGPPFQAPPGDTIEEQLNTFLGPSMARMEMTFESREAYTRFWEQHPSFPDPLPPLVDAHVQHDLVGEPPQLRSSCNQAAIAEDGTELTASEYARSAIYKVSCPLTLLWAPRGMLDQDGGMYDRARVEGLDAELVPDTNHFSIIFGDAGAARVADAIKRAAAEPATALPAA